MKKENLVKFYQTYKLYIFPAAVALSSIFLILFAIYPQTAKLISNQKEAGSLISKSDFLETKVLALESLDAEDLSTKVGFALNALPSEKDFSNILGLLQQLAGQTGFSISSISLSGSTSKLSNIESYEVKMEMNGTKVLLPVFINELENSTRLMKIKKIDVSSGQFSQVVDVSLIVQVLYSSLPQTFGTTDSSLPELSQKDEELLATMARVVGETPISPDTAIAPRGKSNPFE
ncbi:type 4a pilus biogenesis protein PilO [Patescibacteria group bacterium]|nr:type 4a pilus biogenesis protein PilO [Patescibacteria group bacterium]